MTICNNIILTGFMGVGKTTIGKSLAALLQLPFCDIDIEIMKYTGKTIEEIFAIDGEEKFRKVEAQMFAKCIETHRGIIATGGGTLVEQNSRQLALQKGIVICLYAPLWVLEKRISDNRPLKDHCSELWKQRQPVYNSFNHRVNVEGKTPGQVVEEIIQIVN